MSADADDLLERAARAEDRNIPTFDEVKAELEAALDKLERDFPDGKPADDGPGVARLRYGTLIGRVRHCHWQLENGQCVEFPRGRRSRLEGGADAKAWDEFLDEHPELSVGEQLDEARRAELAAMPTFTDEEILAALRTAIENRPQSWLRGAASSGCVVSVLLPNLGDGYRPVAVRTGKHLARLARSGKVVRFRQKWTKGRGSSIWSLPGVEVNEWWLKQYEVDDA